MSERKWAFRIEHMLCATARILDKTKNVACYEAYLDDEDLLDIVSRQFQILGEAARQIPEPARRRYPDIDWQGMIGMRSFVIHEYWRVNHKQVWDVIQNKLPDLKKKLEAIELPEEG